MCTNSTWHDEKRSLWLHGNQAHAENAGSVRGGDAAHAAHFLQAATQRLEVPPAQQDAPVCKSSRRGDAPITSLPSPLQTSASSLPFNSPCPILPSRPITTLHGTDVICTKPRHQSHSFCRPSLRTEPFFLRALRRYCGICILNISLELS